ncbi:hypothetical protein JRO89_XS03G0333700 [Xanthoceras sorbifolium]|uniref:Disease resistance RPP13-like protein 1 n=1 Tax=Xanthoceras sorbifolium TaxID=99658 RepID=A0ABQ8IDD4_9ROSI|nr:hypothetical protein JRO89_XS03G0333700 [Xanthoceras sorbifolium]
MVVGELFLSAFLQVLFDRLASRELLQFLRQEGQHKKLQKWENTLRMVQAVLADAEEKQLTDRAVKMWLDDLRDLAYDVEDILDEFATEALSRKLKMDHASTSKVRKLIPASLRKWSPSAVKFSVHMRSQIKDISSRLEELCKQRNDLGLQMNAGGVSTARLQRPPPSSSVPPEPAVYGRDEDKANLLEMVLRDEPEPDAVSNFRVVSIHAMGGVGKTTLAREVYNDKAVEVFNPRVWVCVSDEFDVLGISKAILESITRSPCNLNSLNEVQVQLKNQVAGKQFLLVLDDLWNEDYGSWEILKSPFLAGAKGSKMIVTTRLEDVALIVGRKIDCYKLKLLSNDDCWSVFKKHAFESEDMGARQSSESTRLKVVEKCRGLPLAARTLGGLLRCKERDDEWEHILNSEIWNLSDANGVLPVLRLSYHHLPSHLKRCFAYCAVLPKDYEFEEKEVVFLWMAEGLIQPSNDNKQPEDLGGEYFHDLLSRSIFQRSIDNDTKFVMHDLVNDLAQMISGDTCFRLDSSSKVNGQSKRLERSRHSSYVCGENDSKDKFEAFHEAELIRSFLPILSERMHAWCPWLYITSYVVLDLLPRLTKLRVLSLRKYYITELPNSLGDLRHLRYLNLSKTMITSLPKSTSLLFNLQTLILRDCRRLKKLPSDMMNLINLRHLDITGVYLKEMPRGIKDLKNLRTLSNFIVSKKSGSDLKDLKYLKFLSGELYISRLENATNLQDGRESILGDKNGLKVLHLEWTSQFDKSRNEEAEENVLGTLRPHKNLIELCVKFYGGRRFPSWVGDPSFSNMMVLRLENCQNCTFLPSLGLLSSLKDLTIKGIPNLKSISSEIYGGGCCSFQSLEIICFEDLQQWERWNPMEENEQHVVRFPRLRKLSIVKCSKLFGRLPNHLPSLEELVVRECEQLAVSISSLPMLCELEIHGCKGLTCSSVMEYESLKSMTLSHFSEFENWLRQGFQKVEYLNIAGCDELINLWQNEICLEQPPKGLNSFTSLTELYIEGCPSLTFIATGHLPLSVKQLNIENCDKLQYLVDDREDTCTSLSCSSSIHLQNINSSSISLLEKLSISHCSSLTCIFSNGKFPASLKHLEIRNCSELTMLSPRAQLPEALEVLGIKFCPKLESIAERFLHNTSLKSIELWSCENLRSIPEGLHNLSHLNAISISNCPSLVSFPEDGLPKTNLDFLFIYDCEKLRALPNHINSLQRLFIEECPSVTSFLQEGFPTNLTSLSIGGLNINKPLVEWGLHNLTSLTDLEIYECPEVESFPQEEIGMMLPLSLQYLTIKSFPKLKYLFPNGFQNVTSLEYLSIHDCPNFTSFPDVGLPSSLLQLYIYGCPLLKKQCKRYKGLEWSKIAHIPRVEIDGTFIYNPEGEE